LYLKAEVPSEAVVKEAMKEQLTANYFSGRNENNFLEMSSTVDWYERFYIHTNMYACIYECAYSYDFIL